MHPNCFLLAGDLQAALLLQSFVPIQRFSHWGGGAVLYFWKKPTFHVPLDNRDEESKSSFAPPPTGSLQRSGIVLGDDMAKPTSATKKLRLRRSSIQVTAWGGQGRTRRAMHFLGSRVLGDKFCSRGI